MADRVQFQTAMRAGACTLLRDFGRDLGIHLAVFEARPASIQPPHAFIDSLSESTSYDAMRERVVRVTAVVCHGLFDTKTAVEQRDRFVDGFADWVYDRIHAAADNTSIGVVAVTDEPTFTADWIDAENNTFYATRIVLEGRATDN